MLATSRHHGAPAARPSLEPTLGLFDLFSSRRGEPGRAAAEIDPIADLVLARLRVGYLVDFDLETWTVTAHHRYDFDGELVEEWELTAGRAKRYLERSAEEGESWSLAEKIPIGMLGEVRQRIIADDEAPDRLEHDGETYYLDGSYAGYFTPVGAKERQPLIKWEYLARDGERFVTVEQWGETELEASAGHAVEEYQFSNILPGGGP